MLPLLAWTGDPTFPLAAPGAVTVQVELTFTLTNTGDGLAEAPIPAVACAVAGYAFELILYTCRAGSKERMWPKGAIKLP